MTLDEPPRTTATRTSGEFARLVCISTDVNASAALQATVAAIVPYARVDAADTSLVRGTPDAECVIIAVDTMYSAATSLVRELRARGYAGAVVLVAESPDRVATGELTQLGVGAIIPQRTLAERSRMRLRKGRRLPT